jgi:hypothetical protein
MPRLLTRSDCSAPSCQCVSPCDAYYRCDTCGQDTETPCVCERLDEARKTALALEQEAAEAEDRATWMRGGGVH